MMNLPMNCHCSNIATGLQYAKLLSRAVAASEATGTLSSNLVGQLQADLGLTCLQEAVHTHGCQAQQTAEAVQERTHHQHVTALLCREVCCKGRHHVEAGWRKLWPLWQAACAMVWLVLCARTVPVQQSSDVMTALVSCPYMSLS